MNTILNRGIASLNPFQEFGNFVIPILNRVTDSSRRWMDLLRMLILGDMETNWLPVGWPGVGDYYRSRRGET